MNHSKNKRGVSVMVGYILLVVFVVVIGALVYSWLVTYVPTEPLNCPDGVSVFVKDAVFDSSNSQLNLTLKNSGRFNFAGYFIHAKTSSSQELATTDLSSYLDESFGGIKFGNAVLFVAASNNALTPNDEKTNTFNIDSGVGAPYSVRIIPTRFQIEDNRERFVSCGDSKVEQIVGAPIVEVCTPDCTGKICGPDGCGGVCTPNTCEDTLGFSCDASGQCIDTSSCIPATPDATLVGICGSAVCGTAINGTCGDVSCGNCNTGFSCDETIGLCVDDTVNDGICDIGETCLDTDCEGQIAQCAAGETCQSGSCVLDTSGVSSCAGYCVLFGYSTGSCTNSAGNCQNDGGVHESTGDQWCTGGPQANLCCCTP